ncbi:MAG: PAS domain S-box protein, partial [Desulfobacterales bacterium]
VILRDEQLKAALKAKNRSALLNQTLTLFGQLNGEHGITHLYFTDPDRLNILRVHKPEKYGDTIDRFTTLEAEKTGKVSHGIELGPLGTFTLRVVEPWYDGQQLIGYVEMGEEIEHITRKLRHVLGVEIYVVIEKKYLDRANWESGMRMLGRDATWDRFPRVVMVDQTLEEFPEPLAGFCAEEQHTSMKTDVYTSFNNRHYRSRFIHLNDASGRGVGDMIVMMDVTHPMAQLHTTLLMIGLICLGVGGILFALLLLYVDRVEREMATAQEKLIQVTKAVESTSDATVMVDPSGQAIYQNRASLELFGYTVEELNEAGGPLILYVDPALAHEVFDTIQGGNSWRGEAEMRTHEGRTVAVALRVDVIRGET